MEGFDAYPLKFAPVLKERIWGGHDLIEMFGQNNQELIGEVWTLSDHSSASSICENGCLKGLTLHEIITRHPDQYLAAPQYERFPILIKFLDAHEDLSVQVHPDDEFASKLENEMGKTESWYILSAGDQAHLVYGHTFAHQNELMSAAKERRVKDYLNFLCVNKGDYVHIPARTLHALLKGVKVIEIQQTSDVTYRLYDWDRLDVNDNSRELHLVKAAQVLEYGSALALPETGLQLEQIYRDEHVLHQRVLSNKYYEVEEIVLAWAYQLSSASFHPQILIVADGTGKLIISGQSGMDLRQGDTILVPVNIRVLKIIPEGKMKLLRVSY